MPIYHAQALPATRGGSPVPGEPFNVSQLSNEEWNAALVDETGAAFTGTAAQHAAAIVNETLSGSTNVAADVLAIPVTHRLVRKTTGADAEALTLADGSVGQVLVVQLVVDGGGDGTLTPATSTQFGTIVFADAGDVAVLRFTDATVGWVIDSLYGLAAQPAYTLPA